MGLSWLATVNAMFSSSEQRNPAHRFTCYDTKVWPTLRAIQRPCMTLVSSYTATSCCTIMPV